jgi:hypothetical protein
MFKVRLAGVFGPAGRTRFARPWLRSIDPSWLARLARHAQLPLEEGDELRIGLIRRDDEVHVVAQALLQQRTPQRLLRAGRRLPPAPTADARGARTAGPMRTGSAARPHEGTRRHSSCHAIRPHMAGPARAQAVSAASSRGPLTVCWHQCACSAPARTDAPPQLWPQPPSRVDHCAWPAWAGRLSHRARGRACRPRPRHS